MVSPSLITQSNEGRVVKGVMVSKAVRVDRVVKVRRWSGWLGWLDVHHMVSPSLITCYHLCVVMADDATITLPHHLMHHLASHSLHLLSPSPESGHSQECGQSNEGRVVKVVRVDRVVKVRRWSGWLGWLCFSHGGQDGLGSRVVWVVGIGYSGKGGQSDQGDVGIELPGKLKRC